jgi:CubicO group peptidase (beta-lactamase class C family)
VSEAQSSEVNAAQANAAGLVDATVGQEQRFAEPFRLIDEAIARKVFPGATLAVTLRGALLAWHGFGRFTYEADAKPVTRETIWDLASLTKPIATTSMAMLLCERGKLSLDAKVVDLLSEFGGGGDFLHRGWREVVTVRMLLAHSSGLPAHRKLYLAVHGREAMLAAARQVPLDAPPMERAEYSDIGFIILGELLERVAGERLDAFCQRELFSPLALNLRFSPEPIRLTDVPPTVNDTAYRGRVVQGEVQDENASAMGGVAGHAGLFGDALSVARFAHRILAGSMLRESTRRESADGETPREGTLSPGQPLFRPETVNLFTARQPEPQGSSRALGWDTPSAPSQSGTHFSPRSFGHLGYTGTSLWCDPERNLSVTLLSNRTWPDAANQAIKELRPRLHDAILDALPAE